jgi:hypothetical protein
VAVGPVTLARLKRFVAADESVYSAKLCGTPASLLVKVIVTDAPAGTVIVDVLNARFWAESATVTGPAMVGTVVAAVVGTVVATVVTVTVGGGVVGVVVGRIVVAVVIGTVIVMVGASVVTVVFGTEVGTVVTTGVAAPGG